MNAQSKTPASVSPPAPPERILNAKDIFGDFREVVIVFEGARYRLRITRNNKLILQK